MSGPFRAPGAARVDRGRTLRFTFDGRAYTGHPGDTLASALLANGVRLVGRSFKYHRPRGIVSAGVDEPNALVTVARDAARRTPNLRATEVELYDGLAATSQNRFPSLAFDIGAVNDLAAPLLPAGFYYKTFMWPRGAWHRGYEPLIRRAAGLGRAPTEADPDRYLNRFAHCEVLVVGAGPAGLAAALVAGRSGARVILCDEQSKMGGTLLSDRDATIDGIAGAAWVARVLSELDAMPNVTRLARTTAFSYGSHNFLGLAERLTDHLALPPSDTPRERLWQVRASEVVLATGALERPLVFAGNDRPGVMLAGAARTYLNRYGVAGGRRAVLFAANDAAYRAALDLGRACVAIRAIVDPRREHRTPLVDLVRAAGIPILFNQTVQRAHGSLAVHGAEICPIDRDGHVGRGRTIACDLLLMSGGMTPTVHLFSQSGGKLRFDAEQGAYVPALSVQRERSAGACRGQHGLAAALADGAAAGRDAAGSSGFPAGVETWRVEDADLVDATSFAGRTPHRATRRARAFVDHQNDVTAKDILLATREGFRSIEHVKRYTTTGMATDQGKTSNMQALAIVADALDVPVTSVGLTTFRMPYTPVTFGTFAGAARGTLLDPERRTPIHPWAERAGAVFEDVGQWKRARYFPRLTAAGLETMDAAVLRECAAVRSSVGMFDASTLGKIEVVGPDAAIFLDRIYVNALSKLAPRRCRYAVLCREDGFVLDDGIIGRVSPDRFHVTTTTGGAARVLALMEDYLQTEWPELDVWLTSVTEQWAVIAIQGPRARDVLAPLVEGVDIGAEALPHMGLVEGRISGVPMRLFRVSFTGELGFEVNVPARHGLAIWEKIFQAGLPHDVAAYGTETMHVLRAEKGYIIVGQETDGTATPDDVGLGGMVSKVKRDFVGKRSLARDCMRAPVRKQLVGLLPENADILLEEGMQIVAVPGRRISLGHVTSSYRSAVLGRGFALAMLAGGRDRLGEQLFIASSQGDIPVRVVTPVFYDPASERLNA